MPVVMTDPTAFYLDFWGCHWWSELQAQLCAGHVLIIFLPSCDLALAQPPRELLTQVCQSLKTETFLRIQHALSFYISFCRSRSFKVHSLQAILMAWRASTFAAKSEDPHGGKINGVKLSPSYSLTSTHILWHVKNLNIKNYQITKRMNLANMSPIIKVCKCKQFHNKQIILHTVHLNHFLSIIRQHPNKSLSKFKYAKWHPKVYFKFLD